MTYSEFQKKIGVKFKSKKILVQAFTHSSYANESEDGLSDNERLEFLGDAILGMVISEYIYKNYGQFAEGKLAKIKSFIVSKPALAKIGRRLEIGQMLLIGKGEELTKGRSKMSNIANALEALIAAVYLDRGLKQVSKFIITQFNDEIEKFVDSAEFDDYKSSLQELIQEKYKGSHLKYEIIQTEGPDHKKVFTVQTRVDGKIYGTGSGRSKKRAEQKAAYKAIRAFREGKGKAGRSRSDKRRAKHTT